MLAFSPSSKLISQSSGFRFFFFFFYDALNVPSNSRAARNRGRSGLLYSSGS
jgi:hypothetical protein